MGRPEIEKADPTTPCRHCDGTDFVMRGCMWQCRYCVRRSEPWPFKFPKPSMDTLKWVYWRGIDEVV